VVWDQDGGVHVNEIITSANHHPESASRGVLTKIDTYKHLFNDGIDFYNAISVSLAGVCCLGEALPYAEAEKLVLALKMGIAIRDEILEQLDVDLEDVQDDTVDFLKFESVVFPEVPDDTVNDVIIDKEFMSDVSSCDSRHKMVFGKSKYTMSCKKSLSQTLYELKGSHEVNEIVHLPMIRLGSRGNHTAAQDYFPLLMRTGPLIHQHRDLESLKEIPVKQRPKGERHQAVSSFNVKLTNENLKEFAKRGVMAKKFKDDPDITEMRTRRKNGYAGCCATHDITDYIESDPQLVDSSYISWLADMADDLEIKDGSGVENKMKFMGQCKLEECFALHVLDRIINELTFAFKINPRDTEGKEFIIKDLNMNGLQLVIRTTRSAGMGEPPIFFFLASDEPFESISSLFEEVHFTSGVYHTKFVSLTRQKVCHLTNCLSTMLGLWETANRSFSYHYTDRVSVSMFRYFLLHYLEDKEYTSKSMSLMRYYYMELIASSSISRSEKIVSKLELPIRSRLYLWNLHHLRNSRDLDVEMGGTPGNEDDYNDSDEISAFELSISNMSSRELRFSISTPWGGTASNLEQVLYLCYVNHTHNKDEQSSFTGAKQIVNKICKEERALSHSKHVKGDRSELVNVESYVHHDWSMKAVKTGAELLRRKLLKKDPELYAGALRKLKSVRMEDLASTKSSTVDTFRGEVSVFSDLQNLQKRAKCYEQLLKLDLQGLNLLDNMQDLVDMCLELNDLSVKVSMFKKPQLTGVREILILDIISRCLVRCLEEVSKHLCLLEESEMLTKPKEKMSTLAAHNDKIMKRRLKHTMTTRMSLDKTTWCQLFVNPVFYTMLSTLIPEMSEMFAFILNIHSRKKLELPKDLVDAFLSHPETEVSSEETNKLKEEFLGRSEPDLIEGPKRVLLRNESNMLQGILHYTSSLLHVCLTLYLKQMLKTKANQLDIILHMTTNVSSDDSGLLVTVTTDHDDYEALFKEFSEFMSRCIWHVDRAFCVETSAIKSTVTNRPLYEFNSAFYSGNTISPCFIKFIFPCFYDIPSETLRGRINSYHNALGDLRANGADGVTCSYVSFLQCICALNGLGAISMGFFDNYSAPIFIHKLSDIGAYRPYPPTCAGLIGPELGDFEACLSSDDTRRLLGSLSRGAFSGSDPIEDVNMNFRLWPTARHKQSLRSLGIPHDYTDHLDFDDLRILFFPAYTVEEMEMKIKINVSSRSVAKSFGFLDRADSISTQTFLLWDRIFEDKDGDLSLNELVKVRDTDLKIQQLFPNYNDLMMILEACKKPIRFKVLRTRAKLRLHTYAGYYTGYPNSREIDKAIRYYWYGERSMAKHQAEACLSDIKNLLPWFSENRDLCLLKSGYSSALSLINKVKSFAIDSKERAFLSRGNTTERSSFIESFCFLNMMSGYSAEYGDPLPSRVRASGFSTSPITSAIENRLNDWKFFLSHCEEAEIKRFEYEMDCDIRNLVNHSVGELKTMTLNKSTRVFALEMLSLVNRESFIKLCDITATNLAWVEPQEQNERNDYIGYGKFVLRLSEGSIEGTVYDNDLLSIKCTEDIVNLDRVLNSFLPGFRRTKDTDVKRVGGIGVPFPEHLCYQKGRIWLCKPYRDSSGEQKKARLRAVYTRTRYINEQNPFIMVDRSYGALRAYLSRSKSIELFNEAFREKSNEERKSKNMKYQDHSLTVIKRMLVDKASKSFDLVIRGGMIETAQSDCGSDDDLSDFDFDDLSFETASVVNEHIEVEDYDFDIFGFLPEGEGENVVHLLYHPLLTEFLKRFNQRNGPGLAFDTLIHEIEISLGVYTSDHRDSVKRLILDILG